MDLVKFGEIMDIFLKKNRVLMMIYVPQGTLDAEVEDNIGLGSVTKLYVLLLALIAVGKEMKKDMDINSEDKEAWEQVVDKILKMAKVDMMEV